jgi:hypothetical protein
MEKPSKKIDVPVLKDVVVPGKAIPGKKTPPLALSEVQLNILQQQIEDIVQKRLQAVLNKASQDAVKDIKTYLDKVLPEFIKTAQKKK